MEGEKVNVVGNSKMALPIDLNEMPTASPRGGFQNAVGRRDIVSICPVCRKGVSVGRTTEEQRVEDKCFRCLLKNESVSSRDGAGLGRLDINAPPPCEVGEADDVVVLTGWSGGKESASGAGIKSSYRNLLESAPESPRSLYLQTLKEFIAERSGLVIEGWHVEFEFCDKSYKTTAVYIASNGIRCKSMEDVARHLGLPSRPNSSDPKNGSKQSCFNQTRSKVYSQNKESTGSILTVNHGQKNTSISSSCQDGYPIQFQDFCIISIGKIDPRPSYHNENQIWPVGYRCSWHDRVTGSLFFCEVTDGGDSGPLFKVHRYPCSAQMLPVGATILSKTEMLYNKEDAMVASDGSSAFQMLEDSMSTITLLNEENPPFLDDFLSDLKKEDGVNNPQDDGYSNFDVGILLKNKSVKSEAEVLSDISGEFQVEGRSKSTVWEMVSQSVLNAFHGIIKQMGTLKLFCRHDMNCLNAETLDSGDSLSRFGCVGDLMTLPVLVQNENDFDRAYQTLLKWFKQDRFGLDLDFVQEIIEQLPEVGCCSGYKYMNDRVFPDMQTVRSGFFNTERKTISTSGIFKKYQVKWGDIESAIDRNPCPLGKPLKSRLPTYLMGDALQVWELIWRFSEDIGLGKPFSFEELESEIVCPWLDDYSFRHETADIGNAASSSAISHCMPTSSDRCSGLLLTSVFVSLLKLLVRELLSKAAAYVFPSYDTAESKARRGKKRDPDSLAAFKKTKLDILPVNEITWHEVARRYILAVSSMEGNLDSAEIAQCESGKVFHCLQGDGGILCGSLTGIAALEGDALVLADAMKEIYGSLKSEKEIVTVYERNSISCGGQTLEVNDSTLPEWALVLEPVRKLPTNVGARIRRCVNEALEKNPPEWAKKILQHSISKEVYKGNASGPTKRAVVSLLAKLNNDEPQQKIEKKEKVKVKTNILDLVTKQCRIVLRHAASSDEDRVFCNLLARVVLNPSDNDDEGILGHPAMVSRPLDFRTIDIRLDAGVYGGSHEAFVDDVREVWRSILMAYGDRSDLADLANELSKKFENLYEEQVLSLVHKIAEASNADEPNADAVKERDDMLFHVFSSPLPKAPWEDGMCKVCGMDKDDDNVLLCDKCDSEYHRYCLNPPLHKIPDGNWYCPSCVAGVSSSVVYTSTTDQCRRRRNHGEYSSRISEDLSHFAKLMEVKECWEFTIEERIMLLKFFSDEALNSAFIHDHLYRCATRAAELQQKLRSLTSELKLLKLREDQLNLSTEKANYGVFNELGDPDSVEPVTPLKYEDGSNAKLTKKSTTGSSQNEQPAGDKANDFPGHQCLDKADTVSSEDFSTVNKNISSLRDSIASTELEILKVSIRKDFLGRDSYGRAYWSLFRPGIRRCIMACGDVKSKDRSPEEFIGVPNSDQWMFYDSDDDIEKLVKWLSENNGRENELRESILHFQATNKLNDSECVHDQAITRESYPKFVASDLCATKAMASLESRHGPCWMSHATISQHNSTGSGMYRCECFQLIWPTKNHCPSCHKSLLTIEELRLHSAGNCKAEPSVVTRCHETEYICRSKKQKLAADEKLNLNVISPQTLAGDNDDHSDFPFNFQDIMTRFTVQGSVKDAVDEIGLISNGGIPSFVLTDSPYLSDPTLSFEPRTNNSWSSEMTIESGNQHQQQMCCEPSASGVTNDKKESKRLSKLAENCSVQEGSAVDPLKPVPRDNVSHGRDKSLRPGVSKNSIIREYSLRPLIGKASEVLRLLKMILLDVDAALPEDALRTSRTNYEKRCAWRAYVKSSRSIYEIVQALIILEDTVKSEYLKNEWWYWSSPSTAARITTLSALATRIYSLDAAIYYEKPKPPSPTAETKITGDESPRSADHKNRNSPKTQEIDTSETPRTRSSKRKKD